VPTTPRDKCRFDGRTSDLQDGKGHEELRTMRTAPARHGQSWPRTTGTTTDALL
jgi:hypothetical protein